MDKSFYNVTNKSGISVVVYKDGYPTWTSATGKADNETNMEVLTLGYAFSIIKTFMSALVFMPIENGS